MLPLPGDTVHEVNVGATEAIVGTIFCGVVAGSEPSLVA
jgi:hypothetical protein